MLKSLNKLHIFSSITVSSQIWPQFTNPHDDLNNLYHLKYYLELYKEVRLWVSSLDENNNNNKDVVSVLALPQQSSQDLCNLPTLLPPFCIDADQKRVVVSSEDKAHHSDGGWRR